MQDVTNPVTAFLLVLYLGRSFFPPLLYAILLFSHDNSNSSFSRTTFQNLQCISDKLSKVSIFQHHNNILKPHRLRDAPTGLTFNNCTFCPQCVYVFCIYLRINSDLCHLQHKLIGFYNRNGKCLQRGTDWVFK